MENFTTDARICIDRTIEPTYTCDPEEDLLLAYKILDTCQWITKNNFSKVCLQFPDEMLSQSAKVYEEIKKRTDDVDLYILGDTSYASCCVDSVAAMHVKGDAVVHYGRSCFSRTNIPEYIVLPKVDLNIETVFQVLQSHLHLDGDLKTCLFYDVTFEHCKDSLSQRWFELFPENYVAFIDGEDSKNRFLGRVVMDQHGHALPMETLTDCSCVYIGSRGQTLFNFCISVPAKQWHLLDPSVGKLETIDETVWFRRRRFLIEKCKDANVVGILVCKLSGEQTKDIISRLKQVCKASQKKSYIVSVGKPNVAKLANFPEIDIYVMIACPENDLYNARDFYAPIVYPYELEVALNSDRPQNYHTYITDFDELLPGRRHYCHIAQPKESSDVSLITGKVREIKIDNTTSATMDLVEKQNWALEQIGHNLSERTWTGLEQKLGETEVKLAEDGRKGIPLQYSNEPQ